MKSKSLKDRLIKVVREIAVYKVGEENSLKEINVDDLSFDVLKTIVSPKKDDPLLYDGYVLNYDQLKQIIQIKNLGVEIDFKKYSYILICSGIYDWKS